MKNNIIKLLPISITLIMILFFYFIMFFGITYRFTSKEFINLEVTNEIVTFNKIFNKDEIDSVNIISDFSNVIIEKSDNDKIEISSKYHQDSTLSITVKRKKLTIRQYSNNAQGIDSNKYILIKVPNKDFEKIKISSPILNVSFNNCYFESIDIKSRVSTIDLVFKKSPKKIKLTIDTGTIHLNIPQSKNNKFKIYTSRSELMFYNKKYIGLINQTFGEGFNLIIIRCGFGFISIY